MRLETGVRGLDVITRGGLIAGGIYLVVGRPGVGKSILGNQIAHAHIARGGRAVYATLLSETHARLLGQVRQLSFFAETAIGAELMYLNALAPLETGGLDGLLKALQKMVREQNAGLLILDGLLPPAQLGVDELAYKKFVAALQTWVGVVGCTVVVLRTGASDGTALAEQTMVDGILELSMHPLGMRALRQLQFTKLRGTGFAEGKHAYTISDAGLRVYPRFEATGSMSEEAGPVGERIPTGTPGLDVLLGGGIVRGSTTLWLGWSGAGKTITTLQFLHAGANAGEPVLYFGFYEPPHALAAKATRLGMNVTPLVENGTFQMLWTEPAEAILDRVVHTIIDTVRTRGVRRLAIDGFAGLRTSDAPERIAPAFSVLLTELSRLGVTTFVTDETRELAPRSIAAPTQHVSALFHNIVHLRQVEQKARLLHLVSVVKTRDSRHDPRLWELTIDDRGLRVAEPFVEASNG